MPTPRRIDRDTIAKARRLIEQDGLTQRETARLLGVSQSGLSTALRREPDADRLAAERPGLDVKGDRAVATARVNAPLGDEHRLLEAEGLDPDDWQIERTTVGKWGFNPNTGEPYRQQKLYLRRRVTMDLVRPAADVAPVERQPRTVMHATKLTVILNDPHAPYEDPDLDPLVEQFLRDVQPDRVVVGGDLLDLPTISRHKKNPAYDASPQECVQAGYEWLRRKVEACPEDTEFDLLLGNHDQRLRDYMLERAEKVYGLAPASIDGEDVEPESVSDMVRRLLHTERLGVQLIEPPRDGEYGKARAVLTRNLAAVHGTTSGNAHARRIVEKRGYSIVYGHDHSKATTYLTRHDWDGYKQLVAVGTGCLCIIEDGLGYCDDPDWQNGFATVAEYEDGTFNAEHATYTAGRLFWRDQRWS